MRLVVTMAMVAASLALVISLITESTMLAGALPFLQWFWLVCLIEAAAIAVGAALLARTLHGPDEQ